MVINLKLEKISILFSQQQSSVQRFPTREIHNNFCLIRERSYLFSLSSPYCIAVNVLVRSNNMLDLECQ